MDSQNLYAFVAWQPSMATDPTGELCIGWVRNTTLCQAVTNRLSFELYGDPIETGARKGQIEQLTAEFSRINRRAPRPGETIARDDANQRKLVDGRWEDLSGRVEGGSLELTVAGILIPAGRAFVLARTGGATVGGAARTGIVTALDEAAAEVTVVNPSSMARGFPRVRTGIRAGTDAGGGGVPGGTGNPVLGNPRVGSALKSDAVKPIRDAQGRIVQEFPATPRAHGFPDVVDNFVGEASQFQLRSGATLYQVEGSLNGVAGRFEWIVDSGQVTHRMFVGGGTVNGIPITP